MADDAASPVADGPTGAAPGRSGSTRVGAGILASRLTGLARERAIGHYLGTSFAADAFTVAFRLPNLLQHLLGEGVLSASFIPNYSRLLGEGRTEEAGRVAGAVLGLLATVTGVVVVAGVLLAEPLTTVVAAGLRQRPETLALTVRLVRLLFPAVGLLVLSAWCLGVLNSHRRFFLSYVAPAVFNLVQVATLVTVGLVVVLPDPVTGVRGPADEARLATWLALGTVVAGLAQVVVQLPAVRAVARGLRLSLRTDLPGVRRTIRAFLPVVGARGVVQVSTFVHVLLASFLAAGALATLRYGQIVYGLPIALFGMAVAAAELPELSRVAPGTGAKTVADRVEPGLARIAALVVPTVVAYVTVGDVLVGALFQTGEFRRTDTVAVWLVVAAYSLGLVATTSSRLLQSALYGVGDPRTPSRTAVVRVTVSTVVGLLLMFSFDRLAVTPAGVQVVGELPALRPLPGDARSGVPGVAHLGAVGLALGGSVSAWLEYLLLRRVVDASLAPVRLGGGELARIVAAGVVAATTAPVVRWVVRDWHPVPGAGLAVVVVGGSYVLAAQAFGVREVRAAVDAGVRRLRR